MADQNMLYKLMVLFMLKKINYSMTGAQISDFMLERGYTTYFVLQETLSQLEEAEYVHGEKIANATYYTITPEGEKTIGYFQNRISAPIRDEITGYLTQNRLRILGEEAVLADYYRNTGGEFDARLRIREKKSNLMDLTITVPDEMQAKAICLQWKKKSEEIYAYLMKELMRGE